jgi:DNA modification methylase
VLVRDRIREFRRVSASRLRPNPRNWRTHPKGQREALQGVLAEIGYADALLARECEDGTLMLVDGHLRAETTPDAEVPVLVLDLTEAEADKLLATLDPLAAMAGADRDRLDALLRDVQTSSAAVADLLTELAEANGILPAAGEPGQGGDEFDALAAQEGPCRVQAGDLWVIDGKHRLLCGDSTNAEGVGRLMGGEKASLCFTSPPYAQQRDYTKAITDWDGLMQGVFANLPVTDDGQVLVNLGLVHREGEWVPYWDDWIAWMRSQGWRRFGWYVWDQGPGMPGDWNGRLAPSHEFVFHFNRNAVRPEKARECKHAGEAHGGKGMRAANGQVKPRSHGQSPVQPTAILDSVFRVHRQGAQHGARGHPAPYPVGFPAAAMQSWPGDVYDPFLGSGTSVIAAHRTGRRCYGVEIEPRYCEIVLRRCEAEGLAIERAD